MRDSQGISAFDFCEKKKPRTRAPDRVTTFRVTADISTPLGSAVLLIARLIFARQWALDTTIEIAAKSRSPDVFGLTPGLEDPIL
jgi:hypothetical protein